MVKPALRVAAAFALLFVLAAPGGAAAAEDTLWTFPDTGERIAAARRDARTLARSFLPGPADLGPGWYRPWEAPRGVPGLLRDEETWWNRLEVAPAWGQFFGLEEEAITQRVRERLDEVFASFAGQATPAGVPPEFQAMASSKSAFLSVPMMRLRQFTMLVQMPQVLAVSKFEAVGHAYLKARFTEKPEAIQATIARQFPDLLRALDANLEGLGYGDALRAYAREVRNVRRHTRMVFVRADPEAWANPDSRKLPDYAVFTVDLSVLARSAIGTWIRDVTPEDAGRVQQDVASSLAKTWSLTKEIAGLQAGKQREALEAQIDRVARAGGDTSQLEAQLAEVDEQAALLAAATPARPTLAMRDLGDNAWVLSLDGLPRIQEKKFAALQARLRNGNAVADVRVQGTYPKAALVDTLDDLLGALDARTQVFVEDE